jgi:hypothetical protein
VNPSTIRDERAALAAFLRTISGLHGYRVWPDNVQTPAALVRPLRRVDVVQGPDAMPNRWYTIEVLVSLGDNESAQDQLDQYLEEFGPYSIRQALSFNPTLNGAVDQCVYHGWSDYGARKTEAHVFIGAMITVEIFPRED